MSRFWACGLLIVTLAISSMSAPAQKPATQTEQDQPSASAQSKSDKKAEAIRASEKLSATDSEYAEAMKFYRQHRDFEALPLLEKLAERYPSDLVAVERLGISLIVTNIELKDAEARKQQRARARKLLVRANELGADDDLNAYYLRVIPEDGGDDIVFSAQKEVEHEMQEGEKAFARNDFGAAIQAYTRAMLLDPNLYAPALFIGDAYFASRVYDSAVEWFLRATLVDPNRETAYRYWGDALMRLGQMDEARSKFIEAIIAEPYTRQPWVGLKQWADANKVQVSYPDIKAPPRPKTTEKNDGTTNIVINAKSLIGPTPKDGTSAWTMYQLICGAWQAKLFKERFPDAKQYRHTLAEEEAALGAVAASVEEDLKKGKLEAKNLDSGIATLAKLHEAGLLEPYILISRADEGIAQDYGWYREKNRDKLRQYLNEFLVPKIQVKNIRIVPD